MSEEKRVKIILNLLEKAYPAPKTELLFENEMQLAVSVILSAQTTDKKVNQITRNLFKKYKSWKDFATADLAELTKDIHGVNFHKGKAERLIKAGQIVEAEFGGKLPQSLDELIKIPGVARKSANVILNELWDIAEGVVVDTHISRVSYRLGLTRNTNPVKIEKDLMRILPKNSWRLFSGAIVLHGRYICVARKPKCAECVLNQVCPSAFKF